MYGLQNKNKCHVCYYSCKTTATKCDCWQLSLLGVFEQVKTFSTYTEILVVNSSSNATFNML